MSNVMNSKHFMKNIIIAITTALALSSCVDTVILPDNKTTDDEFWQKKTEVEAVVGAAYSQLRNETFMRNIIVWADFRSDELNIANQLPTSAAYKTALEEIYALNTQPNNAFTSWTPFYSCINYANLILEKAEGVTKIDPDYTEGDYKANCAQAKALRALCYFYLVRVFRDVPVTEKSYMNASDAVAIEQTAPAQVLQMCIDDLNSVVNDAPESDAYGDWRDRCYMNKDAIYSLLADIYLWRGSINHDAADYQKCVDCCQKVIASKKSKHTFKHMETESDYYLSEYRTMYDDLFSYSSMSLAEESIFELDFKQSGATNTGLSQMYYNYSRNTDKKPYLVTTSNYATAGASSTSSNVFKNSFDVRMYEYSFDAGSTSNEQFNVRKYVAYQGKGKAEADKREENQTLKSNWIIYRLTDVMLMEAEALLAIDGEGNKQAAFDLIKAVNERALTTTGYSLNLNTYTDKMDQLLLQERARELCFEGKRWFDLMRYNYRLMPDGAVDLTKTLAQIQEEGGTFASNTSEFLSLALNKYANANAMQTKMPTEPYLYMPINEDEVKVNSLLKQNPVYKSTSSK